MKCKTLAWLWVGVAFASALPLPGNAQTATPAFNIAAGTMGNHRMEAHLGIANDFEVLRPITIWSLGVFDHKGDGIQGTSVLKVRLFAGNPDRARKRASGVLLETVLFDAADSGEQHGGFRCKALPRPVTLIPGKYTITAEGFDEQNPDFKWRGPSTNQTTSPIVLSDGNGAIRFSGVSFYHVGRFLQRTRTAKDPASPERAADRYATATFVYSPSPHYNSPFAADYAALTDGVRSFAWDTNKSGNYTYRYGSVSVLDENAFPVLVEPSGNRTVFEAGGIAANGARCVVFADGQWAQARGSDAKAVLFENAIRWTGQKADPRQLVVGMSASLDADHFRRSGFRVFAVDGALNIMSETDAPGCDVLVLDLRQGCSDQLVALAAEFVAAGGGLVIACPPAKKGEPYDASAIARANRLLRPFGLALRSSVVVLNDFGLTNVQEAPYPPKLFNAFPAADLLRQDRHGQSRLTSLEKAVAMNTMSYAADGRPDLLTALAAAYSGSSNSAIGVLSGQLGSFRDAVVLDGAQANDSRLGSWRREGSDLVSADSRGSVEYDFETTAAGVFRIQVFGAESLPRDFQPGASLVLSVDGIPLGQCGFQVPHGMGTLLALFGAQLGQTSVGVSQPVSDRVECLTPFLSPGSHKLRVFWNNPNVLAQLRLNRIHVQMAEGADADADGVADWVRGLIEQQCGMDFTNDTLGSYTSPVCLEGRDAFPQLMDIQVAGAATTAPNLTPAPAPDGRWYVNVPLAAGNDTTLQVSYQGGAKLETRKLRWLPVNVLDGGHYTIRDGDSLLLVALPPGGSGGAGGTMQFVIGTNRLTRSVSSPLTHVFAGSDTVTVTGTYTPPGGTPQTGSLTVHVVQHGFQSSPACHVGEERVWEVDLPAGVVLETDQRLLVGQLPVGERLTSLTIDQSEPRQMISRLGTNGPILASSVATGFDFWSGRDTYLKLLETYPDGSELVEMMLVLHPVPPDVVVQLDVLVGGVVFEDGTVSRQLTKSDFDALGRCRVRFIHPPTFKPSICHSIKILQGTAVVGRVW